MLTLNLDSVRSFRRNLSPKFSKSDILNPPKMSQMIDSQHLSSEYRDALQECASSMSNFLNGYMTPPPSATSRRHSLAISDFSGHFPSGSFSNSDYSSFSELPTPTSSISASSSRHHSITYSNLQPHTVSEPSPNYSLKYNEPNTPSDLNQSSVFGCFSPNAPYLCANSSPSFSNDPKSGVLGEGLLMTMPGISDGLSTDLITQDLHDGRISPYEQAPSITLGGIPDFDTSTRLDGSFSDPEVDYSQNCSSGTNWPTHLVSPETVDPSHTFIFSSPPGSPSAHHLGSPIKLEHMPLQRASFDTLSAYGEISPVSSPTTSGRRASDMAVTPTPRSRGFSRLHKVRRISGWKKENRTGLQFPMCDIQKIRTIETNPCLPCSTPNKRVAFKRPEHLKRHLLTDQHTKNVMEDAKNRGIRCPSPMDKPVYPCLIPNCKKGLDKAPFVGRRDNLTQHYKNTHFHDKHKNGGGKNDWVSVERAEELGLASKDPRNKEKYEG